MYNKNYRNTKKNNGINTADIDNQLHQHLANRARLQEEQDRLWDKVHRGYNCQSEMNAVDKKIGNNTYAIDALINKLIKARCRSGRAFHMSVGYLKNEIARNQRIISKWTNIINDVERGRSGLIRCDGHRHSNTTSLRGYVAKKKQKTAQLQRQLSQLVA